MSFSIRDIVQRFFKWKPKDHRNGCSRNDHTHRRIQIVCVHCKLYRNDGRNRPEDCHADATMSLATIKRKLSGAIHDRICELRETTSVTNNIGLKILLIQQSWWYQIES